MKKKILDPKSPEYRDIVAKLTSASPNLSLPPLQIPQIQIPQKQIPQSPQIQIPQVKSLGLTGVRDLDITILLELNDIDLFKVCQTNKYISLICENESLWRRKLSKRYNKTEKPKETTWKEYYISLKREEEKDIGYNLYYLNDVGKFGIGHGVFFPYYVAREKTKVYGSILIQSNVDFFPESIDIYKKDILYAMFNTRTKKLKSPIFRKKDLSKLKKYEKMFENNPDIIKILIGIAQLKFPL